MHIGKAGNRLDREMIERHAVADFAEHLPDIAVEARLGLVGEAEEGNAAARIDIVERVGGTGAHVEGAELARCVEAELHAVDASAALPRIGMQIGADVTGGKAGAPGFAEARIDAGEEAAEAAGQRSRIAVAIALAPAADTLRPESEITRRRIRHGLDRHAGATGCRRRISQLRPGKTQRAEFTGCTGIGSLPHTREHCAARELRFLGLRRVHAAVDFARQGIEGLPRAVRALEQKRGDERIGHRAVVERGCDRILVSCLCRRGKTERSAAATRPAATCATASCTSATGATASGAAATTARGARSRVIAGERPRHTIDAVAYEA